MSNEYKFLLAVGVLIFRPVAGAVTSELLLMRRTKGHQAGSWGLPGGKVEPNESWIDTGKRELLEETGLKFCSGRVVDGHSYRHPDGKMVLGVTIAAEDWYRDDEFPKAPFCRDDGASELRWFPWEERDGKWGVFLPAGETMHAPLHLFIDHANQNPHFVLRERELRPRQPD